jgi:hypothetical protein
MDNSLADQSSRHTTNDDTATARLLTSSCGPPDSRGVVRRRADRPAGRLFVHDQATGILDHLEVGAEHERDCESRPAGWMEDVVSAGDDQIVALRNIQGCATGISATLDRIPARPGTLAAGCRRQARIALCLRPGGSMGEASPWSAGKSGRQRPSPAGVRVDRAILEAA